MQASITRARRPANEARSATDDAVRTRVLSALHQTTCLEGAVVSESTSIAHDLALGHFGRMRFALFLEEAFDLELPDDAVEGFTVIGDVVRYLSRRWSPEVAW